MKTLVLCTLLGAAAISLTGCETTVVEHRHGYYDRGYYGHRSGYYANRASYGDRYHDHGYRSGRTVVVANSPGDHRSGYVSSRNRTVVAARTPGGTVVVSNPKHKHYRHDHDRD
jgi:hypothetical protein